ncbi:MAG: AraC family transcriptional regulator ligand-binding domain-containing protein [Terricaulis silvestris]
MRADTLRSFRTLVGQLGGDADALLKEARLDDRINPDTYISFRSVIHLVERAAIVLDCPDFGMRFTGIRGDNDNALGALAVAMQNARTAREAIRYCEKFMHFHNLALEARLQPADEPGCEFFALEHRVSRPPRMVQTAERMMCFSTRFIGLIAGEQPREAWLWHARVAPLASYRAMFQTPMVRFSMPRQGLLLSTRTLDAPRTEASEHLKRIAEHFLESAAPMVDDRIAARARSIIDRTMRIGECTQADLARALGLHERTLQRRLQAEHTSFEQLKDDVRRDMARELLAQPNVSLSRVGEMLGYAETSAFTRSSHRWFGKSPREMRKELRGEEAA